MALFHTQTHASQVRRFLTDYGKAGNVQHMIIGLATETAEIIGEFKDQLYFGGTLDKTNLTAEIGDVMFYGCLGLDELGEDVLLNDYIGEPILDKVNPLDQALHVFRRAGLLAGCLQIDRSVQDGTFAFVGTPAVYATMRRDMALLMKDLALLAGSLGIPIQEASEANVRKLYSRYPEGHFSVERAQNRDVVAEKAALENKPKRGRKKKVTSEDQLSLNLENPAS